jgi:DNA-binding response OmpR family regulator
MMAADSGSARTVLVADDEPNIVLALEFLLRKSGYEVLIARDGETALKLVEAHEPDLVVLDVMMPLRSGYEVCKRMRERAEWQHIKVVMLTAKGRDVEMERGLSAGANLYITKPFSTQALVASIKGLLGAP